MLREGEALLKNAGQQLRKEYRSARDRVASSMSPPAAEARQGLRTFDTSMLARVRTTAKGTNRYVQDHPWQAFLAGACIGLAVAALVRRK